MRREKYTVHIDRTALRCQCVGDMTTPVHCCNQPCKLGSSMNQCVGVWATVCKTVRPMLSGRCLSVLSVTLVYCSQTVGWIKIKLGMQVSLGLGHIVGPSHPSQRGTAPYFLPMSVAAK